MTERTKDLEESADQEGQYSRRNCLLIHGVEENSNEDTDKLVLNIISNDLEIDLTEIAIDRTHRTGDPKKKKKKVLPIIVKFDRYYYRKQVFSKKKHLKGKSISITESLTSFRWRSLKKHEKNMVLKLSGRLMIVSCLKTQMISQAYIIINLLKHYGKRIWSLVRVVRVVICSWGYFHLG